MEIKGKRIYRDTLFKFTFGNPDHKDLTLSLYNAMNGTDYRDPSLIEINTIEDVLYLGMRNDVSFLVGDTLSLYESQSTYNPNMPLRMLQYAAGIYEAFCKENELDKYSSRVLALPSPRLVVFYNGSTKEPDEKEFRLSDSFGKDSVHDIEVCVHMVNINRGHNLDLMKRCRPLSDYSAFVGSVESNRRKVEFSEAIDMAIGELGDDSVLKRLLEIHKAEVKDMLLTEYNEQEQLRLTRKDAYRIGHEEGREEGNEQIIKLNAALLKEKRYDDLEKATFDPEFRERLLRELGI